MGSPALRAVSRTTAASTDDRYTADEIVLALLTVMPGSDLVSVVLDAFDALEMLVVTRAVAIDVLRSCDLGHLVSEQVLLEVDVATGYVCASSVLT